jgi:dihydrofolate reductase
MKVSIIAAIAKGRAIGKDNNLIWHLPADMRFFSETTRGHHVLMGRKNWESIPHKYQPLPGRTNIVITRNANYHADGATVFTRLQKGIAWAEKRGEEHLFIIGGGQIYKLALDLDLVDTMYLTQVNEEFEADTFFPEFDESNWKKKLIMNYKRDEKNPHDFSVFHFQKVRG